MYGLLRRVARQRSTPGKMFDREGTSVSTPITINREAPWAQKLVKIQSVLLCSSESRPIRFPLIVTMTYRRIYNESRRLTT